MDLLNRILNKCVHSGAEMAEVYSLSQKKLAVTVRDGKVEAIKKSTPGGLAVRYFSFGKTAFGHTTDTSDSALDSLIARLSRLVRKTSKDEYAGLPGVKDYEQNLDIYGPEFINIPTEHKIDYLVSLEKQALNYDPLIERSNGASYEETQSTISLVNTNGIAMSFDSTLYTIKLSVTAVRKGDMFPGESEFSARYFADLPRPQAIVEHTASKAVRLIGGSIIDGGDYEIIFTPEAADSILWGMLFALNGENYLKGSSFFVGREGNKIAIDKFNLYDDQLMKRGVASRPADAEGSASIKLPLIENGILRSPMYDTRTAAKAGTSSTASASRRNYNGFPGIWPSNFYIAAGDDKIDDVVSSCKKGIIVEVTQGWGLHSVTGQYSAGINGTLVRNGKRIKPVANVTIAASAEDLFNGMGAICDDITFYRAFSSPSLMIKKMKVGS